MRPEISFPLSAWQTFQEHAPVRSLLAKLPSVQGVREWPSPEAWQVLAIDSRVWDTLGQNLVFTLEEKPGQRARRKQKLTLETKPGSARSYEASICEKQEIPTRAHNLHDFFNAVIWLNFPRAKFALHRRAYEIQNAWWRDHGREKRCPLADRLTCFDEGGLVFDLPPEVTRGEAEALFLSRADEAKKDFVQQYAARFTFFGHGMMEVMMKGNLAIHAACIILDAGAEPADQRLARYLQSFGEESPDHGSVNVSWLCGA